MSKQSEFDVILGLNSLFADLDNEEHDRDAVPLTVEALRKGA